MTALLTEAFQKASQLPDGLQDQLAREGLEEIESEGRWDETLAGSRDKLDRLAEKARQQYLAGETKEMGFDEL
jgi:hypothetical protein